MPSPCSAIRMLPDRLALASLLPGIG
jgi:hypothetical protein